MTKIGYMCLENNEEKVSPILEIAWIHQGLEYYIKKSKERLISAASNSIDNIRTNRTTTQTRK